MTKTTLQLASTKSDSLRTTVPTWVVSHFKLKAGDKLDWDMKVVDGRLSLVLVPSKKGKLRK